MQILTVSVCYWDMHTLLYTWFLWVGQLSEAMCKILYKCELGVWLSARGLGQQERSCVPALQKKKKRKR